MSRSESRRLSPRISRNPKLSNYNDVSQVDCTKALWKMTCISDLGQEIYDRVSDKRHATSCWTIQLAQNKAAQRSWLNIVSHNLQHSRSTSPYTKISMSASRNASPLLRRLESVVDDDDGDEVNWSVELESRPIWRSARLFFRHLAGFQTAPKICVRRIPAQCGGRF
jgi:hypothetical protein